MDEATKKEAVAKVALLIEHSYVFPDLAKRLSEALLENYSQQSYSGINNPYDFANVLNEDIRYLSNDKHLHVSTDVQLIDSLRSETTESRNEILHD